MSIGLIKNSKLYAIQYDLLEYLRFLLSNAAFINKGKKLLSSKRKLLIVVKSTLSNSYLTFAVDNKIKFMTSAGRIGFRDRETKRLPTANYKIGERFILFLEKNRFKYKTNLLYVYRTGNKKLFGPFFKNLKIYLKKEYINWQKKLVPVLSNLLRIYWRYLFLVMQSAARKKSTKPLKKLGPHDTFSFMELLTHAFGKSLPFKTNEDEGYAVSKNIIKVPVFSKIRKTIKPKLVMSKKRDKVTIPFSEKRKVLRLLRRYKRLYSPNIRPIKLLYLRSFSSYPFNGCKRRWRRAIPRYW